MLGYAPRWAVLLGSVAVLMGGTSASYGQATTSLHDIPWYEAHPAVRKATRELCQSDHRFSRDVDCANAETAETKAWGKRSAKYAFSDLVSPEYWAANGLGRKGVLWGCAKPVPTNEPDVCAAARQGDAIASAHRGRQ